MAATNGLGQSLTGMDKDSQNQQFRQCYPKLFYLLDAVPVHAFSASGRANICRRFRLTDQELEACLLAYQHPEGPRTEAERRAADITELLSAREAVSTAPARKASKNAGKAKEGRKQCK